MPRIIHFEIAADDPERAANFYVEVFGWEIEKWAGPVDYWLVTTGPDEEPGINGAIKRRLSQSQPVTNTVEVADIDVSLRQAEAAGGLVIMAKTPVPGVGYHAYCRDTEGNIFGLMQTDSAV